MANKQGEIPWNLGRLLDNNADVLAIQRKRNITSFMLNGQDFHVEQSRFSWWSVEIFMLNGQDFHDERSRFSCWTVEIFMFERSRFSWWTVEIFMMNGPDFHDERSGFSRWQVMTDRDFHNDRSRIALLLRLNPWARGEDLAIQLFGFIHVLPLST